jgi:hypothetical protein
MKLKDKKITQKDLEEYSDKYSDFSFEMKVLNCFPDTYMVNHGGTYEDPISGKFREFDIRAKYSFNTPHTHNIYMAVEAKNIQDNFPLLISCVPRLKEEAYHDLVISKFKGAHYTSYIEYGKINTVRPSKNDFYKTGEFVGKSLDQIGRKEHGENELIGNDSDIYSKWSQAVNSSFELADTAFYESLDNQRKIFISFILPIVVIPDNTLWIARYDHEGNRLGEIEKNEECQYYICNKFVIGDKISSEEIILTHLHIMTFSKFEQFVNGIENYHDVIFPQSGIHF